MCLCVVCAVYNVSAVCAVCALYVYGFCVLRGGSVCLSCACVVSLCLFVCCVCMSVFVICVCVLFYFLGGRAAASTESKNGGRGMRVRLMQPCNRRATEAPKQVFRSVSSRVRLAVAMHCTPLAASARRGDDTAESSKESNSSSEHE